MSYGHGWLCLYGPPIDGKVLEIKMAAHIEEQFVAEWPQRSAQLLMAMKAMVEKRMGAEPEAREYLCPRCNLGALFLVGERFSPECPRCAETGIVRRMECRR
jgi:hypothetical protein